MSVNILAFSGSTRKGSLNQKLVNVSVVGATKPGVIVTNLDLANFPLPIFNQDLETSDPPECLPALKEMFNLANGFLIASPEYNSSLSPLLKNTIDWVSRPAEGEQPLQAFTGKVAGIMSASPGGLGGLRGLVHLRSILQNIGVMVVPEQFALGKAHEAFDEDGDLNVANVKQTVVGIGTRVADVASKLSN